MDPDARKFLDYPGIIRATMDAAQWAELGRVAKELGAMAAAAGIEVVTEMPKKTSRASGRSEGKNRRLKPGCCGLLGIPAWIHEGQQVTGPGMAADDKFTVYREGRIVTRTASLYDAVIDVQTLGGEIKTADNRCVRTVGQDVVILALLEDGRREALKEGGQGVEYIVECMAQISAHYGCGPLLGE